MENQERIRLAVIGGDARQLIAAARLREAGYETALYGFLPTAQSGAPPTVDAQCCSSCSAQPRELAESIAAAGCLCSTLEQALEGAQAVILPLPVSSDGRHVSMPLAQGCRLLFAELIEKMAGVGIGVLCGGKLGVDFSKLCDAHGIEVFDYYEREEFAVANAIPTAEGAIAIAMNELPVTLHGASALIIGYGRIGKVLAKLTAGLGMDVTVSARKPSDFAWIRAEGYHTAETVRLAKLLAEHRYNVIFNTVPRTVLGEGELRHVPTGTLIVDLASKPGGVDIAAADRMALNVIWALSLPGKVAPVTSGHIIADTILGYMKREEGGSLC